MFPVEVRDDGAGSDGVRVVVEGALVGLQDPQGDQVALSQALLQGDEVGRALLAQAMKWILREGREP